MNISRDTLRICLALACLLALGVRVRSAEPTPAAPSNDEFFDPNRLLEVQITMPAEDFEKLRQQHRDLGAELSQGRGETALALPKAFDWFKGDVTIGGVTVGNVGIRMALPKGT